MAFLPVTFYGDFVFETGDHNLPVTDIGRAMDGNQVTVQYADIFHTHTFDPQQVMRYRIEHRRIDAYTIFDIFFGQDGIACGHPADQWQPR